jgi:hypothetical protein
MKKAIFNFGIKTVSGIAVWIVTALLSAQLAQAGQRTLPQDLSGAVHAQVATPLQGQGKADARAKAERKAKADADAKTKAGANAEAGALDKASADADAKAKKDAQLIGDLAQRLNSTDACIAGFEGTYTDPRSIPDSLTQAKQDIAAAGKQFGIVVGSLSSGVCQEEEVTDALREDLWYVARLEASLSPELNSPGPATQSILSALHDFSQFRPIEDERRGSFLSRIFQNKNKTFMLSLFCSLLAIVFLLLTRWPLLSVQQGGKSQLRAQEIAEEKALDAATCALEAARKLIKLLETQTAQLKQQATAQERVRLAENLAEFGRRRVTQRAPQPPVERVDQAPIPSQQVFDPGPATPAGPIADYNRCLEMGLTSAEDLFYGRYTELRRLTCENLDEHRNPNAKLRFKMDGRGNFMVLIDQSQMKVLPAIGLDPVESRKLLEGVFQYPEGRGKVRLRSAALVKAETADTFLVRERGAFERA